MPTSAPNLPQSQPPLNSGAGLILLAGLGADQRQWRPQVEVFPDAVTPDWIPFQPGESLVAYAARYGAGLPIGSDTVLAGSSFGGMLALEMARQARVKPRAVVLIGSCREPGATNPLLRLTERVGRLLPDIVIDWGRVVGVMFVGRGGPIPVPYRALLVAAAKDMSIGFLRSAGRAIIDWPGCPDPGVPVHHIHGSNDWVIFPSRVRADVLVPGGAHVLNLSHAQRVNEFLRACASTGEATPRANAGTPAPSHA